MTEAGIEHFKSASLVLQHVVTWFLVFTHVYTGALAQSQSTDSAPNDDQGQQDP